jgi:hypothetical protein
LDPAALLQREVVEVHRAAAAAAAAEDGSIAAA